MQKAHRAAVSSASTGYTSPSSISSVYTHSLGDVQRPLDGERHSREDEQGVRVRARLYSASSGAKGIEDNRELRGGVRVWSGVEVHGERHEDGLAG